MFTWNALGWLSVQFLFKPISRIPSDVNERENEAWLRLSLPALCSFFLFLLRYFTWFLNEMTSDHAVCLPTFTPMSAFKPSDWMYLSLRKLLQKIKESWISHPSKGKVLKWDALLLRACLWLAQSQPVLPLAKVVLRKHSRETRTARSVAGYQRRGKREQGECDSRLR